MKTNIKIFIIASVVMALIIGGIFIFYIKPKPIAKVDAPQSDDNMNSTGFDVLSKSVEKPSSY